MSKHNKEQYKPHLHTTILKMFKEDITGGGTGEDRKKRVKSSDANIGADEWRHPILGPSGKIHPYSHDL